MYKVVVDTNIIVSAVIFDGKPEKILTLVNQGRIEIFLSPFILKETQKVLRDKFEWGLPKIKELMLALQMVATTVQPKHKISIIKLKKSDNRILEAAYAVRADFLITGDAKHLLPLKQWRGIKIISAQELLNSVDF